MNADNIAEVDIRCSFCGCGGTELDHLIKAPQEGVYICEDCATACVVMFHEIRKNIQEKN